ncbi:MAG TPA: hypothetical protein VHR66_00680 [Gemmataceae bacterium]|jgi:hypothetical protein|nr:hypothetical protein [Gemmataceae bacterium]
MRKTIASWLPTLMATALLAASTANADEYGKWVKDEKQKTYVCEYKYETKASTKAKPDYAVQNAVIYYADPERKNWVYYYNAKSDPWARCAAPTHPKYDNTAMYWQHLGEDKHNYIDYPDKGYCPAPKNGKNPIPAFPLPPK